MREPFTSLHVHLVWATWNRLPLIVADVRDRVYPCLQAEAHRLGCEVIAIGGIEDHVHTLVRFVPAVAIAELVKHMKGASSRLVNSEVRPGEFFKWQGGYGAFSIAANDVDSVRRYVDRQEEHHRSGRLNETLERLGVDPPPHVRAGKHAVTGP